MAIVELEDREVAVWKQNYIKIYVFNYRTTSGDTLGSALVRLHLYMYMWVCVCVWELVCVEVRIEEFRAVMIYEYNNVLKFSERL